MFRNILNHRSLQLCFLAFVLQAALARPVQGDVTGYTEPAQTVEVAAAESGRIAKLFVKVGDFVEKGQLIGRLDSEIQMAQVKIAKLLAESEGDIARAKFEIKSKELVLKNLKELEAEGFAQKKEIMRAELELESARSALLARQEKLAESKMRYELAQLQLKQREIRSPLSGQIGEIKRREGEFVSLTNPAVVTIVQTDPVHAKFQVPLRYIQKFPKDQKVNVRIGTDQFEAKVERVGLSVTSETVSIYVEVPNEDYKIKVGRKCVLIGPVKTKQFTTR